MNFKEITLSLLIISLFYTNSEASVIKGVTFGPASQITQLPVTVAQGGTGLTVLGAASTCLQVNAGATALVYAPCGSGITALTGDVTASGTGSVAATVVNIEGTPVYNTADSGAFGSSLAIGAGALGGQTLSSAYSNTAVGAAALGGTLTTAAKDNTAIGYHSLNTLTNQTNDTAIGYNSLITGNNSVVIGTSSSSMATDAVVVGEYSSESGLDSIVIGQGISGNANNQIIIGQAASAASGAVALGQSANSTAVNAIALGNSTNNRGTNGVSIGAQAGSSSLSGANNVILGPSVASTVLTTGTNNILIGTSSATTTPAAASSNEINLGGLIFWNTNSTAAPVVTSCGTNSIDSHANNRSGTVSITAGTPSSCTITFAGSGYTTWNHCRVTSEGVNASFAYSYSLTGITVTGTALAGKLDYDCDGY